MNNATQACRDAAHAYLDQGLPITLCAGGDGKHPLGIGWTESHIGKGWGQHRWTHREIDRAFRLRGHLNVGLLLGPDSGLIDAEADSSAEERALGKLFDGDPPITPTFASRRGKHRLFRYSKYLRDKKIGVAHFEGLGVRIGADKAIHSCAPPSLNTDGTQRQWLITPEECDLAELPESVVAKLLANYTQRNQRNQRNQKAQDIIGSSAPSVCNPSDGQNIEARIEAAIRRTLPPYIGRRDRCIFEFCRELRAIPELADANPHDLQPLVRRWYDLAEPNIGTKEFAVTLAAFLKGWPKVEVPKGQTALDMAFAQAQSSDQSTIPAVLDCDNLRLLAALCRELQAQAGDGPFYLGCRPMGDLFGVVPKTAWNWLDALCTLSVLQKVSSGNRKERKASEYRYLG